MLKGFKRFRFNDQCRAQSRIRFYPRLKVSSASCTVYSNKNGAVKPLYGVGILKARTDRL